MGIFTRRIIFAIVILPDLACAIMCTNSNSNETYVCSTVSHWAGLSHQKTHTTPNRIGVHLDNWQMLQLSNKLPQIHYTQEFLARTHQPPIRRSEIFLKVNDPKDTISFMYGWFRHPFRVMRFPIFGTYDETFEEDFIAPKSEGLWLSLDNHRSFLLDFAASKSIYSARYSYDSHYLGGSRFSLAFIRTKTADYMTGSFFTISKDNILYLMEVTRVDHNSEPFKQVIRLSYLDRFQYGYRKFMQYDEVRLWLRRLIFGYDFQTSDQNKDMIFRVFAEYKNDFQPHNWYWAFHTGIGGTL